jgi:hypothetical protein
MVLPTVQSSKMGRALQDGDHVTLDHVKNEKGKGEVFPVL